MHKTSNCPPPSSEQKHLINGRHSRGKTGQVHRTNHISKDRALIDKSSFDQISLVEIQDLSRTPRTPTSVNVPPNSCPALKASHLPPRREDVVPRQRHRSRTACFIITVKPFTNPDFTASQLFTTPHDYLKTSMRIQSATLRTTLSKPSTSTRLAPAARTTFLASATTLKSRTSTTPISNNTHRIILGKQSLFHTQTRNMASATSFYDFKPLDSKFFPLSS